MGECLGGAEHGGNSLVTCVWRDISVLLGRTQVLCVVGADVCRVVSRGACLCGPLFLPLRGCPVRWRRVWRESLFSPVATCHTRRPFFASTNSTMAKQHVGTWLPERVQGRRQFCFTVCLSTNVNKW